jgi:hypothetical protein
VIASTLQIAASIAVIFIALNVFIAILMNR